MPNSLPDTLPPDVRQWLLVLLAIVLSAAILEGLIQTVVRRKAYDWRAFAATMADTVCRRAIDALGISIAIPILSWAYQHRLTTIELTTGWAVAILFLGQEFFYYWYHRAAHRVRWFWATHCVHHSPNELTLASALRLGWTGKLTGTVVFFAPLVWVGFSPVAVFAALAANLLYQFWVHATWIPKLGPLEWIFNTPSHHRVHHGSNPEYLDCNYGGVLIIFDRLFGTFVEERDDIEIRYGLTEPLMSYNPLRIALHGWILLAKDVAAATSWKQRWGIVLGPPGNQTDQTPPVVQPLRSA